MKTIGSYSFSNILKSLAQMKPEEKLRTAFRLNDFVKKIYKEGTYARTKRRARTTA